MAIQGSDDNLGPMLYLDEEPRPAIGEGDDGSQWEEASSAGGNVGQRWKIDHSSGSHRFQASKFIDRVLHKDIEPADAIRMLQANYTIDYGSRQAGGRPARPVDEFYPQFYLDFLSIVGKPGQPISVRDGPIFDNITVSFRNWAAPYKARHVGGIPFDITGRTFHIAQASTREVWFIVMHPDSGVISELPRSAAWGRRAAEQAAAQSGLPRPLARELAAYITGIFEDGDLLGEGVESCWRPGSQHSQRMSTSKWTMFQEMFMSGWQDWAAAHEDGSFWRKHNPAFHAYDYGANIQIEVTPRIYSLPRERHRPQGGDGDSDADVDEDDYGGAATKQAEEVTVLSDDDSATEGLVDREDDVEEGDEHYRQMIEESEGLQKLSAELRARFRMDSVAAISYALAVCLNSCDGGPPSQESRAARCLLVDRNEIAKEFIRSRDYTFYPQAFHPAYGNISSAAPPAFLDSLTTAMRGNMSRRNDGTDVLSFGYFQGYSNIKRSVRHSPLDLLATKGYATAAMTVPLVDACGTSLSRDRRERLLAAMRGQKTPESPEESRPFARERRQVDLAIDSEEVAYRLEQVVSVNVGRMAEEERTFGAVLRPIFQLMRFFLVEHESYVHIFRSMPLQVFPRIVSAYSRLFELALGEMERRFVNGGERGLDLAHSEAVAVLDRLGGYCFTGHERHLPKGVLRALGTLDSLRLRGWPYMDPRVLDMGEGGSAGLGGGGAVLDIGRWPVVEKTGRPQLLHVSELRYHYGDRIASSRESELWFAQLSMATLQSRSALSDFLAELLRELWIPQSKAFMTVQLRRRLHEGGAGKPGNESLVTTDNIEQCEVAIREWEESEDAFTWKGLGRLNDGVSAGGSRTTIDTGSTQTRHDYARTLISAMWHDRSSDAFAAKAASWSSRLRIAVQDGQKRGGSVDLEAWTSALAGCLLVAAIEWAPGSIRGRVTSRSVTRLQGMAGADMGSSMMKMRAISGPPGSLGRLAQEAEVKHEMAMIRRAQEQLKPLRKMSFGSAFPFTAIPGLVHDGFKKAQENFTRGDTKVLDHYQLAIWCLTENLDNPACQLMLLLTLTVCASSETPDFNMERHEFISAAKKKDAAQLALVMVTRMLWYLYPKSFPWSKGSGGTAYDVAEMTKKIEHKGCSNRMLCGLGWTTVVGGKRPTPRNTEIRVESEERLLRKLKGLHKALNRPEEFISLVFQSHDLLWVERCDSIIKDRNAIIE